MLCNEPMSYNLYVYMIYILSYNDPISHIMRKYEPI